jgi:hypothetical protein
MWKFTIYGNESIFVPHLNGPDPVVNYLFGGVKTFPEANVLILPRGRYWGGFGGVILDSNGKIIHEYYEQSVNQVQIPASVKISSVPSQYYRNVALLDCIYSTNYFHWMFDVIARIDFIRKSNIPIDKYIVNCTLPFQNEMLNYLGIPEGKRIYVTPHLYVQGINLIVPSFVLTRRLSVPKYAIDFLRNEFLAKRNVEKIPGYEKIYISRGKAVHRKITNEEEVMELLEKKGFKLIYAEDEPFERKIKLFQSADLVVAPHGAGLTNLLFCKPGTKVIEIFNPGWVIPCFHLISHYIGLNYQYLLGKDNGYRMYNVDNISADILVDVDQLSNMIDAL